VIHGDLPCAELIRHESSQESVHGATVDAPQADAPRRADAPQADAPRRADERRPDTPATVDDAIRLAIKLAVDAGAYERAAALLDVAKRTTPKPASVTPLTVARERGKP
jgi:hypothetical protein